MIVVIQCAAGKSHRAGCLRTASGKPVHFVADPHAAPANAALMYARPDDPSDWGGSWREVLLKYNEDPDDNPLDLSSAYMLYENRAYFWLVGRYNVTHVYILSAGWGLIRADFLTPYYDITFSPSAESYKRRRKTDHYDDFCMLPANTEDEIVFFGGKDYVPLFCSLTAGVRTKKTVFYNSAQPPRATGCALKRFNTTTRTNWHYECVNAFIEGSIDAE
jgi:hypothetical protein